MTGLKLTDINKRVGVPGMSPMPVIPWEPFNMLYYKRLVQLSI